MKEESKDQIINAQAEAIAILQKRIRQLEVFIKKNELLVPLSDDYAGKGRKIGRSPAQKVFKPNPNSKLPAWVQRNFHD